MNLQIKKKKKKHFEQKKCSKHRFYQVSNFLRNTSKTKLSNINLFIYSKRQKLGVFLWN